MVNGRVKRADACMTYDETNSTYGEDGRQQSTSLEIHSADLSEQ